nr:reverse transcriptase domain-containing protein [Tanacetum cinerariifolium]
MSLGLCNALATFQRCMTEIFHDMVKDFMEVFMDDCLVFGNSFSCCLANLDKMLARCEETNLVLNWEKYHFMVKDGIVLGHKISWAGIELDRAKIDRDHIRGPYANYYSNAHDEEEQEDEEIWITSITVNGKAAYELKGKFHDDLRDNAFSGINEEDAVKHIEYFLKILDPIDLPNVNYERLRLAVFQSHYEWYDELTDSSLKEEALKQKAIYEKSWGDATQNIDHIRGPYANYYSNAHDEEEQEDEEICELFDDPSQEQLICKTKRLEMIKYSFG